VADCVFDGATRHARTAVLIDGAHVARLIPASDLPRDCPARVLREGFWLAPGFVDLQVNGGGDALFNDAPTPGTIARIAAAHRKFGTTGFLVTLITDTREKTQAAIEAV